MIQQNQKYYIIFDHIFQTLTLRNMYVVSVVIMPITEALIYICMHVIKRRTRTLRRCIEIKILRSTATTTCLFIKLF